MTVNAELLSQQSSANALSPTRLRLLEKTLRLLKEDGALILVTGKAGVGKSYFLNCLTAHLFAAHKIFRLQQDTQCDVIQQIAQQLNINHNPLDTAHLTATVHRTLAAQPSAVLLCDDVDQFSDADLEQLRQFNNLGDGTTDRIKIVLCATNRLLDRLSKKKFAGLTQRVTARVEIAPFAYTETASYLLDRYQMHFAVDPTPLALTDRDIKTFHDKSNGLPQKLNCLVDARLSIPDAAPDKPSRPLSATLKLLTITLITIALLWHYMRPLLSPQKTPAPLVPTGALETRDFTEAVSLKLDYAQPTPRSQSETSLIEGAHWLSMQSDNTYTIQLALLLSPQGLTLSSKAHIIELSSNGAKLYGIYQGTFNSVETATQAARNTLSDGRPLIKKIAQIKIEHSAP